MCWHIPIGKDGDQVSDSYNYFGTICLTDELEGVGYEIIDIQSRDGDYHGGKVKVVSLKKLLDITFDCGWATPPLRESTSTAKRKRT